MPLTTAADEPCSDRLSSSALALLAAVLCLFAALHLHRPDERSLPCNLGLSLSGRAQTVFINNTHGVLPRGSRLVWRTHGSARPEQRVLTLPHALARGETLVLQLDPAPAASRCRVELVPPP